MNFFLPINFLTNYDSWVLTILFPLRIIDNLGSSSIPASMLLRRIDAPEAHMCAYARSTLSHQIHYEVFGWRQLLMMMLLQRVDADIPPFQQFWTMLPKSHLHIMVFGNFLMGENLFIKIVIAHHRGGSGHPGSTGTLCTSLRCFFTLCPNSPQLFPIHSSCPNSPSWRSIT